MNAQKAIAALIGPHLTSTAKAALIELSAAAAELREILDQYSALCDPRQLAIARTNFETAFMFAVLSLINDQTVQP